MNDESRDRMAEIQQTLDGLKGAWPAITAYCDAEVAKHVADLIQQDNEQTRGRIKALSDLAKYPVTLTQELEGIQQSALADQAAGID